MKRLLLTLVMAALGTSFGCDKPTEEQCKKAVENIRKLTGTSQSDFGADPQAAIRSCKSNASKASVQCMTEAKTIEALTKCEGDAAEKFIQQEEEAEKKRREDWKKKQKEEGK